MTARHGWHPVWCDPTVCTAGGRIEPAHRSAAIVVDLARGEALLLHLVHHLGVPAASVDLIVVEPPVPAPYYLADPLASISVPAPRVDAVRHALTSLARLAGVTG